MRIFAAKSTFRTELQRDGIEQLLDRRVGSDELVDCLTQVGLGGLAEQQRQIRTAMKIATRISTTPMVIEPITS